MKKLIILFFLFNFVFIVKAQTYNQKDPEILKSKIEYALNEKLQDKPISTVISTIGRTFLGVNYEAFTCEIDSVEKLVVNLRTLDCTTFLETVLTLSRCIKLGATSFEDYQKQLTYVRYRDGKLDEYPSRLHYFSDWIFNNQQKGIVKDITKEIGGEKIKFALNFMSTHPESYKHLKNNPRFIPTIKKQEEAISKRENYYYVPLDKVEIIEDKIKDGDLIAITANIPGIDVGHVGIAVREADGKIHFMHAPLVGSKVQITKDPLHVYLKKVKKNTGIIVLRVNEPK